MTLQLAIHGLGLFACGTLFGSGVSTLTYEGSGAGFVLTSAGVIGATLNVAAYAFS